MATLALSQEQAAFLVNAGLSTLLAAGTVALMDMSEEEFAAEITKQQEASENTDNNSGVTSDEVLKVDSKLH